MDRRFRVTKEWYRRMLGKEYCKSIHQFPALKENVDYLIRGKELFIDAVHIQPMRLQTRGIIYEELNADLLMNEHCENKAYLIELCKRDFTPIALKVGATKEKNCTKRFHDILKNPTYQKMGARKILVLRLYDCKDYPPESMESIMRAYLIKQNPQGFIPSDRFYPMKVNLAEIDNLYQEYFQEKS